MYQFHDEITRALTGTRFQAKLTEYRVACVNGFFLSCANVALLELIQEIEEGSPERARLVEMYNTYRVLEDLMRDRKTLLATRSDPNASDTMVAFADNCLSTRFENDIASYGPSAEAITSFIRLLQGAVRQGHAHRLRQGLGHPPARHPVHRRAVAEAAGGPEAELGRLVLAEDEEPGQGLRQEGQQRRTDHRGQAAGLMVFAAVPSLASVPSPHTGI